MHPDRQGSPRPGPSFALGFRRPRFRSAFVLGAIVLGASVDVPVRAENSLDLGFADTGISIGNSARWRGLRINGVDEDMESIRSSA